MALAAVRDRTLAIVMGLLVIALAAALLLIPHGPASTTAPQPPLLATPATPPPPPWTAAQLQDLVDTVRTAEAEGLRPSDYQLPALEQALTGGRAGPAVDALAEAATVALAHDYAAGRVRNRHRFNWYIDYAGPDTAALAALATAARAKGALKAWLTGLLPPSPQYRALREALAGTPADDEGHRDRIKANLERWRWLPRDFGQGDQLYVNLPTYQLELIRGGETVARYPAVIGATGMPTPVLTSPVRQVIANPDWIVPQSIVRKSHLRPGASSRYVFSTRPDGSVRVRQKPGPGNALGRIKIEFPNKLAIYFHDTPSRSLFGATTRAFSHGCVRVQDIETLAASIVRDQDRLATALAGANTRGLAVIKPLQANIVYLTLVPGPDGALAEVGDPYKMDEPLAAALTGRKPRPAAPEAIPAAQPTPARPVHRTAPRVAADRPDQVSPVRAAPADVPSMDAPTMNYPADLPAPGNTN